MKTSPTVIRHLVVGCLIFSVACGAEAESSNQAAIPVGPPILLAGPLAAAPELDGSGDDPVWSSCVEVRDMAVLAGRILPSNETAFRLGYTPENLYVLVQCASHGARPKVTVRDHDGPVFTDDAIELYLEPVAGSGKYYHFVANAAGARYEGVGTDASWNGTWEAIGAVKDDAWTLEFAIPFTTLGVKPVAGTTLGLNLARNDLIGNQLQSWSGGFHDPGNFGRLALGESAIGATGLTGLYRERDGIAAFGELTNSAGGAQNINWLLAGTVGGEPFRFEQALEVPRNASRTIERETVVESEDGWAGWRSMLAAGATTLYRSPAMRSPILRLPVLDRKREPTVLSNELIRLVFDANSGALVSLSNLVTGQEMLAGLESSPLFRLDTVNYAKNPLFFREDDVRVLKPGLRTFRSARVRAETGGTAQVLTQVHQFEEGVTVTATIRVTAGDPVSKWDIAVSNSLPRRPRDAVIVHRVTFPNLGGLKAAETDADQAAALPYNAGRLVREPGRNLAESPRMAIPGWTSMSWMDLSGPTGGLYLASHDVRPVAQTILTARSESEGKVEFSITRWSVLWPGKTWRPQACSVGLHAGDWHWSADRYRDWYYAAVTPRATPAWLSAEDGWIFDGMEDRFTCQDLARRLTMGRNQGIGYIQSWQAPGQYNQGGILGWFLANVYGGKEKDFREAIGGIHRRGGRVGFYMNMGDMEANMGAIMNQPRYTQKLPKDVLERMPAADPLSDGWLESGVMQPDGSYRMGWPSGIDTWSGCLGSAKGWGPWYYYTVVTKHALEYRTDAWYADCHPGLSEGMCFSPHHAHKCPESLGQITLDFGERVARNVGKDFGMLGEGFCDRFFTFNTHALYCQPVTHREDDEPAIFRYTHPRFPLFCGTCRYTWGAPSALYTRLLGLGNVSFADHLRYVLLYGMRFDVFAGPTYADPASLHNSGAILNEKEQRDLIFLRKSVHQDLEDADFRDQVGLTGVPAKTQARLFVRRDRAGGLITIFDARPEKTAFSLSLKLTPHRLAAIAGAEIFLPGGTKQTMATPVVKDNAAVFAVPKIEARMLIVRFAAQAEPAGP
ncbi:MAG: hypothetical protein PHR35_06245 [Kiritimatiellae bacterium]|nr:hypothetical protein [Kiritimatiellia bacterium]